MSEKKDAIDQGRRGLLTTAAGAAGLAAAAPAAVLEKLCAACGIAFDNAMLSWPAGPKPYDGAWAPHW